MGLQCYAIETEATVCITGWFIYVTNGSNISYSSNSIETEATVCTVLLFGLITSPTAVISATAAMV